MGILNRVFRNRAKECYDTYSSSHNARCDSGLRMCDQIESELAKTELASPSIAEDLWKACKMNKEVVNGITYLDVTEAVSGPVPPSLAVKAARAILAISKERVAEFARGDNPEYKDGAFACMKMEDDIRNTNNALGSVLESLGYERQ